MKRDTPRRTPLTAIAIIVILLSGLLPSALPRRAAAATGPPRLVLTAGGSAKPITVVDRHRFLVNAPGFQGGESVKIQATYPTYSGDDIVQSRTATANGGGNVSNVSMFAPAGAKAGWASVTAVGQTSNKQAQGRVLVAYRPYIFLADKSIAIGSSVTVKGRAFVANTQVRVQITIRDTSGNTPTLSVTATADNNGNFTRSIRIPGYTTPGTYTVTATDMTGGFKRNARVAVSRRPAPRPTPRPTATATPQPTFHPSARVVPSATLPNQDVTFTGTGFPANTAVSVGVTVNMRGGGNRQISKTAVTDSKGSFTTAFRVPYKAAPGTYTVTGAASNVQASDRLQVLPRSAHPKNLGFRQVSLWYHTVRQGTWDYITVQSTVQKQLGIWVHVIFPSGRHLDYFTLTDRKGRWATRFNVPRGSASRHSNQAYIAFQLWHGKQTMQAFIQFTLV